MRRDGLRRAFSPRAAARLVAVALATLCLSARTLPADTVQAPPRKLPEIRPGILAGYLPAESLPHSRNLLPPPPSERSVAFALDEQASKNSRNLPGTPRWDLATQDADLSFPKAAETFSCALMASISEEHTPHLYILLRRTLADAALSTYPAKKYYARARPFLVNKQPICTPSAEAHLAHEGSYPSGHSAVGWAWALVLSEIAPDKTDALLARGRAFGQSRVVCNVHWQSDVLAGQIMGAGVVARLHADPAFLADLNAAKRELAAVRASSLPSKDCEAESAALAFDP
jgi:acid phosphatase (class A)